MRGPTDDEMIKKIVLVAEMYYMYGMSQEEIASRMKMSRPWVSKLLKRAEEMGIIHIEVHSPLSGNSELEAKLKAKYKIANKIAVIQPAYSGSINSVGNATANYLVSKIKDNDIVGVNWGLSVYTAVECVLPISMENVTVVPLVGGIGSQLECQCNIIASKLATALSANYKLLHSNAYCVNEREYQILMQNPMVKDVIDVGQKCDIAIYGLGGMENNRMIESGCITPKQLDALNKKGAVGDLALRFLDSEGEILDLDVNNRVIACDLKKIREHAREVIAIGFGEQKVEIIKAAMKGDLITTLFTDTKTAEMLLED